MYVCPKETITKIIKNIRIKKSKLFSNKLFIYLFKYISQNLTINHLNYFLPTVGVEIRVDRFSRRKLRTSFSM